MAKKKQKQTQKFKKYKEGNCYCIEKVDVTGKCRFCGGAIDEE